MFIFKYVTKHPKLQSDIFRHFDVIEKMEQSRGGEEEKEKLFLSPWRRRGAVDNASASGTRRPGFESRQGVRFQGKQSSPVVY
jgi:hypothetical protein